MSENCFYEQLLSRHHSRLRRKKTRRRMFRHHHCFYSHMGGARPMQFLGAGGTATSNLSGKTSRAYPLTTRSLFDTNINGGHTGTACVRLKEAQRRSLTRSSSLACFAQRKISLPHPERVESPYSSLIVLTVFRIFQTAKPD